MAAPGGETEPTDLIRSVSRALRIVEQVAGSARPVPVKVIARTCGLNLSTAYHLVRTLSYEGYLIRRDGGYVVGSKMAHLYHEMVGAFTRPPHARAVLRHVAEATGHTAYLACLAGDRLVIVDLVEGARSPWLEDLQVGLETAVHATALGKALLVALPRRSRRRLLAVNGMRPFTANTPTEPAQVDVELHRLRPGDLVTEHGQFREQVACAGVAFPGADRGTWWALGASVRGLELPSWLLAALRTAATDLGPGGR
jgi:DNA-binding IclR family transcriptional regulator